MYYLMLAPLTQHSVRFFYDIICSVVIVPLVFTAVNFIILVYHNSSVSSIIDGYLSCFYFGGIKDVLQ